jgi:hypothetical protein
VKAGDTVLVRRYGKRGRPSVRSVAVIVPGVVVKANGSYHCVLINGQRLWINAKSISLTEQV